jgi:hypothetical protein
MKKRGLGITMNTLLERYFIVASLVNICVLGAAVSNRLSQASDWIDATLPNGMHMRMPGGSLEAEMPYAAGVAGGDPTAFAAVTTAFQTNPALAMAAREQAHTKQAVSRRISSLEGVVQVTSHRVASALFDLKVCFVR